MWTFSSRPSHQDLSKGLTRLLQNGVVSSDKVWWNVLAVVFVDFYVLLTFIFAVLTCPRQHGELWKRREHSSKFVLTKLVSFFFQPTRYEGHLLCYCLV